MTDSIIIINPLPLRNRKPRAIRPRLPWIIVPHDGLDKFQICFLRHLLKELWHATLLSIVFSNKSRRYYHLVTTLKINILPFSNLILRTCIELCQLFLLYCFQVYNAPKFFELRTAFDEESNRYYIDATEMRINTYYYSIYNIWLNFIFMGLGPFIILISLNGLTLRSLIIHLKLENPLSSAFVNEERSKPGKIML